MGKNIRTLKLNGSATEIGFAHGTAYKQDIVRYANERVELVMEGKWSGNHQLSRAAVLKIAEDCLPAHEAYAPNLMDELRGMANATELSLAELIIVGGFTDFVDTVYATYQQTTPLPPKLAIDDCTAFIVPDSQTNQGGFFGQTWDMHDTATEFVILLDLQTEDQPNALVFTTTGCVGQIGMNEHGIAVGINNLLGADGQTGVTWPFVVRKVLQQDNLTDALACITETKLAGAHNYLLFDKSGKGYNIEAMPSATYIEELQETPIIHTNHCLVSATNAVAQKRLPEAQANSENRLLQARDYLKMPVIEVEDLQQLTQEAPVCQVSAPPFHIETCGAAIMRPKTGDFWAVWGSPAENPYEHFKINSGGDSK